MNEDRQALLRAHVASVQDTPCQWGHDDCSAWVADWVRKARGSHTAAPAYSTKDDAYSLISAAGGLLTLWERMAAAFGCFEARYPEFGDVGLIRTARFGPVGVIFTTDGVALWRAEVGITALRPRPETIIKAWTV